MSSQRVRKSGLRGAVRAGAEQWRIQYQYLLSSKVMLLSDSIITKLSQEDIPLCYTCCETPNRHYGTTEVVGNPDTSWREAAGHVEVQKLGWFYHWNCCFSCVYCEYAEKEAILSCRASAHDRIG
jgi:hypothetical protein